VRRQLVAQRDAGQAVLFVSEDIDELVQVCDTIAVLSEGKVMGVIPAADADPERMGLMMAGVGQEESA
jgi:simple sugar transport system ATP-binding protein